MARVRVKSRSQNYPRRQECWRSAGLKALMRWNRAFITDFQPRTNLIDIMSSAIADR
jgi:hypothetical protein